MDGRTHRRHIGVAITGAAQSGLRYCDQNLRHVTAPDRIVPRTSTSWSARDTQHLIFSPPPPPQQSHTDVPTVDISASAVVSVASISRPTVGDLRPAISQFLYHSDVTLDNDLSFYTHHAHCLSYSRMRDDGEIGS